MEAKQSICVKEVLESREGIHTTHKALTQNLKYKQFQHRVVVGNIPTTVRGITFLSIGVGTLAIEPLRNTAAHLYYFREPI